MWLDFAEKVALDEILHNFKMDKQIEGPFDICKTNIGVFLENKLCYLLN